MKTWQPNGNEGYVNRHENTMCKMQSDTREVSTSIVESQMREQWGVGRHWEGGLETI